MIRKKVCMLGDFYVGKTSLIARYVKSIFSEKYHTTIGVKIDKKVVNADGEEVTLLLWDLNAEDEFQSISLSYLRGMSGFFLVADATRKETLDKAFEILKTVREHNFAVPFILLINKIDLNTEREILDKDLVELREKNLRVMLTSAKSGSGVEEAFLALTSEMLNASQD